MPAQMTDILQLSLKKFEQSLKSPNFSNLFAQKHLVSLACFQNPNAFFRRSEFPKIDGRPDYREQQPLAGFMGGPRGCGGMRKRKIGKGEKDRGGRGGRDEGREEETEGDCFVPKSLN